MIKIEIIERDNPRYPINMSYQADYNSAEAVPMIIKIVKNEGIKNLETFFEFASTVVRDTYSPLEWSLLTTILEPLIIDRNEIDFCISNKQLVPKLRPR